MGRDSGRFTPKSVVERFRFRGTPEKTTTPDGTTLVIPRRDGTIVTIDYLTDKHTSDRLSVTAPTGEKVDLVSLVPASMRLKILQPGQATQDVVEPNSDVPTTVIGDNEVAYFTGKKGVTRLLRGIADMHIDDYFRQRTELRFRDIQGIRAYRSGRQVRRGRIADAEEIAFTMMASQFAEDAFANTVLTRLRYHGIDIAPSVAIDIDPNKARTLPQLSVPDIHLEVGDKQHIIQGTRQDPRLLESLSDLQGREGMALFSPVDSIMFEAGQESGTRNEVPVYVIGNLADAGFTNVSTAYAAVPLTPETNNSFFRMRFQLAGTDDLYPSGQNSDAVAGALTFPLRTRRPEGMEDGKYVVLSSTLFYDPYSSVPFGPERTHVEGVEVSRFQPKTGEIIWSKLVPVPQQN